MGTCILKRLPRVKMCHVIKTCNIFVYFKNLVSLKPFGESNMFWYFGSCKFLSSISRDRTNSSFICIPTLISLSATDFIHGRLWCTFFFLENTTYKILTSFLKCFSESSRLKKTPTASLQRRKSPQMSVLVMTLNNLMVRLQSWRHGKCGVPLHYHYSEVHSDQER